MRPSQGADADSLKQTLTARHLWWPYACAMDESLPAESSLTKKESNKERASEASWWHLSKAYAAARKASDSPTGGSEHQRVASVI